MELITLYLIGLISLEVRNALRFSLGVHRLVDSSTEIVEVKEVSPGSYRLSAILPTSTAVRSQIGMNRFLENVTSSSPSTLRC
jgi:hypothetical protein